MPSPDEADDAFDDLMFDESAIAQIDAATVQAAARCLGRTETPPPDPEESLLQDDGEAPSSSLSVLPASGQPSNLTHESAPATVHCPETPRAAPVRAPSHAATCTDDAVERPPDAAKKGLTASQPMTFDDEDEEGDMWDERFLMQLEKVEQKGCPRSANDRTSAEDCPAPRRQVAQSNVQATMRPLQRTQSGNESFKQRTLFGDRAVETLRGPGILSLSSQGAGGADGSKGPRKANRTQQWNASARAPLSRQQTHRQNSAADRDRHEGRGSEAAGICDDSDYIVEAWQDGPPSVSLSGVAAPLPPDSMKLQLDTEAARTFLYPTNMAKRDYQYNIVQKALFDNVLVALPTGLGKTFIAAVVILNFFRWYPQGKIIFVAPSKPLVAQQQLACHGICGLPWDVACEMTGDNPRARRSDDWEQKRIFYMTPQTLQNDIATEQVDPKDIVCLVVDEAHRATGNYAYCGIVAQIQAVNPYFRILALTATPGTNSQRVQEVIDNLHISLIELRTEEAIDIRQYVHKKREEAMVVDMPEDIGHVRELFLEYMEDNCQALVKHGLLPRAEAGRLHDHQVRRAFSDRSDILARKRWLGGVLNETAKMAEARKLLDVYSLKMFRERVDGLLKSLKKQDNKKAKLAQILNLAASIPTETHPKMVATVDTLLNHFKAEHGAGTSTRVMIFCSLRECVREICDALEQFPELKATPFIGQASDKTGKGLTQKQQKEVIAKFKTGVFNILVATSIGEEGLDIGEVDLILCYEAPKNSIRMLQRVGRTGRKRDGRVVVLLSEYESNNWQQSKDNYKGVQQLITVGNNVTLYDDVPRLIPPSVRPTVQFAELDQPEFRPELISSRKNAVKGRQTNQAAQKRKARLSDPHRNAPEGALMGFLQASALGRGLREGDTPSTGRNNRRAHSSAKIFSSPTDTPLSDDSDDEAIERGLLLRREGLTPRCSMGPAPRGNLLDMADSSAAALRKSSPSLSDDAQRTKRKANPTLAEPAARRSSRALSSDGLALTPAQSPRQAARATEIEQDGQGSQEHVAQRGVADMHESNVPLDLSREFSPSWPCDDDLIIDLSQAARAGEGLSLGCIAREPEPPGPSESPCRTKVHPLIASLAASEGVDLFGQPALAEVDCNKTAESSRLARPDTRRLSFDGQDEPVPPPLVNLRDSLREKAECRDADPIVIGDSSPVAILRRRRRPSPVSDQTEDSPLIARKRQVRAAARAVPSSSPPDTTSAPLSAKRPRKPRSSRAPVTPAVDGQAAPASSRPHVRGNAVPLRADAKERQSKATKSKRRRKIIGNSPTSRAFFQLEAERDTDEERRQPNRSDSDDEGLDTDLADSSDLEHVGEFEATQAPKGYNQRAIYQQSLLTQGAPTPFRRQTVGGFYGGRWGQQEPGSTGNARMEAVRLRGGRDARGRPSSGDEEDSYSLGSFVCDDGDVEYATEGSGDGGTGDEGGD
ncbi:unnamed protein product [Parajaminaea phylloscopi]